MERIMDRTWKTKITNLLRPKRAAENALRAEAYAALEEMSYLHTHAVKSWVPQDISKDKV